MKNRALILICGLFFSLLYGQACELKWNRPWLVSGNHLSLLELQQDEDLIFIPEMRERKLQESEFNFAFSSVNCFKQALLNFISKSDNSTLLYYRSPDQYEQDPLSSYIHPASIPLRSMLKFSLTSGLDHVIVDDNSYSFIYYRTRMSGFINQRLFFTGEWWAGHFTGQMEEAEQSHLIDSWTQYSKNDNKLYLDNVSGRLTYRGKGNFWSASIGKGKHEIGSNIGGSIILNDACNDYGYFSSKFVFKDFYLSYLHGALIPDSSRTNSTKDFSDKFLVIHKIGWTPADNFELFIGEEIIYANRSLDLNYLLPQSYMRATEHNLSDRDNALIFAGLNYQPVPKLHIFFNFLLDEFRKSEFLGNWWGNKYALQLGTSFTFQREKSGIASLEFTAVRPWLYTHYVLENRFSHNDIPLGFPSGSNLLQYTAEINYDLWPGLNVNAKAIYRRQGSVGNSFTINYNDRPSDTADWLEGKITDTAEISPVITWRILAHHSIKIAYSWEYNRNTDSSDSQLYFSYQADY